MSASGTKGSPTPRVSQPRWALLALEGLSDPDNAGVVFRNAAAFGVAGVLLSSHCADPLHRKAIRASMGATLFPWRSRGRRTGRRLAEIC